MIQLPTEFQEFLKSFKKKEVKYLLVGGYAVGYHGYPRATADIDVWVDVSLQNAQRIVDALVDFGFEVDNLESELFLEENRVVRMGNAPLRIEILMSISGVEFEECYRSRIIDVWESVEVSVIGLDCLKKNKRASGRLKDLSDLEYLSR